MVAKTEVPEGNNEGLECKRAKVHKSFVREESDTGGTEGCTVRSREQQRAKERKSRKTNALYYQSVIDY